MLVQSDNWEAWGEQEAGDFVKTTAFQSLLALSNPFDAGDHEEIIQSVSDWNEVIRLADTNRTLLLLFKNLGAHRGSIPDEAWDNLEKQAELRLSVWRVMETEIARIQAQLNDSDIRWMLIKTLHGFPREIRDLDLLIFDGKLRALRDALAPLGYEVSGKLSGLKMEFKTRRDINGRKVAVALDVHSRISYEGLSFVNEDEMWASHENAQVDGTTVPIPSPQHQIVTLVLNSTFGDGGLRLADVFEFGTLLQAGARMEAARRIARKYGWNVALSAFEEECAPYLAWLRTEGREKGPVQGRPDLSELPARFDSTILLRGLLQKAAHDLGRGGVGFLPSWGRLGMKFMAKVSFNHLRTDSWNRIFYR